ncbi:MAG: hypothetical protein KC433_08945 [Anaerolineales bacterium]|nr:hypothetical protein [Anaerolineales bacterium]MCB8939881.1 hypothetical protein [Ardenticatenaceae bacterium]
MDQETFAEFKNSFSYGSRTDLNFKFFKSMSDEDTAVFLQSLLAKVVTAADSGDWVPVLDHVIAGQTAVYSQPTNYVYEDAPFAPLPKPLAELKLGLLTSSGHFVAGDDPQPFGAENMTQAEATARIQEFLREEPMLSEIPIDTPAEKLRVRHGGYDIAGALDDPNVNLPLAHVRTLLGEGVIGQLHPTAYSFVGACAQTPLQKRSAPRWAEMLKAQGIEAMLLVPV